MEAKTMRITFLIFAVVLFAIAYHFGDGKPFDEVLVSSSVAVTSNMTAGLTAIGFCIAGGAALVAAAVIKKDS